MGSKCDFSLTEPETVIFISHSWFLWIADFVSTRCRIAKGLIASSVLIVFRRKKSLFPKNFKID